MEMSGQLHTSAALPLGETASSAHWFEGRASPRAGLDAVEKRKVLPYRESNPGGPASD
jgi:hypothetical protein